ncbi:hypothetical protein [Actinomadura sp. GTD37]|uniref:hypothetical protein n=1 Tax=Actinomadura sp. GTD37 TaxID=1778030 RepID=UPI0035C0745D
MTGTPWRFHAYEPYWIPRHDWETHLDWILANNIGDASTRHDITVTGDTITYTRAGDDHQFTEATVPLTTPPTIARPDIPHLPELQASLAEHHRASAPGPLLVLGSTLTADASALAPGAAICATCTGSPTIQRETNLVAWPCTPVKAAADLAEVTLW